MLLEAVVLLSQVLPDGSIKIIDRKKDLVKLQAGEYVSLGKVEANLKIHPLIENICVYGDSFHTSTVALVVPDEDNLKSVASSIRKQNLSRQDLCRDPAMIRAVQDVILKHAATVKLEKFEVPKQISLIEDQWTPESGLVTAAFKLKRRPIQNKYQDLLDKMYEKLDNTITVSMDLNGRQHFHMNKVAPA